MASAKWLDFQVFSDKDDKPEVPSHKPCSHITLWDVKEPTHYSKRVGDVVPGVVVYLRHLHHHSSWVGRVQWAHKLNGLIAAAIGAFSTLMSEPTAKKQCKEDMYVCPLNRDITHYTLRFEGNNKIHCSPVINWFVLQPNKWIKPWKTKPILKRASRF